MNILILTSIYPQQDDEQHAGVTPVVHYFSKEWVKAGHNVKVIHNSGRFPQLIHVLPDRILKKINSTFGIVIPNKNQSSKLFAESDNVTSYRLPMMKFIPKMKFFNYQINKQYREIISILKNEKYNPDVVIGHWENPQIQLLSMLKDNLGVKTALTFHELVYIKQNRYKKWAMNHIKNVDVIGARSAAIAKETKEYLSLEEEPFICYSGIDDAFLKECDQPLNKIKEKNSYLYVGRLIKRKNVDCTISAINNLYLGESFKFSIVGEGSEKSNLSKITEELGLEDNVSILGYKSREEVRKIMKHTEVYIMISNNETFGLVYLEAMSQGCIVIASKNGGMDGIIRHNHNGFLCEQGNEEELYIICKEIRMMSDDEKKKIAENAIETANNYSDYKAAEQYLINIS